MDFDELQHRLVARARETLVTIHTVEGNYEYFNADAHLKEGIDVRSLFGTKWQEYADGTIEREQKLIRRLISGESPMSVSAKRTWPRRTVSLSATVSLIRSAGGSNLVLREGRIIDPTSDPIDVTINALGNAGGVDACDRMNDSLKFLIGLAAQHDMSLIQYMLQMAQDAIDEHRKEVVKEALS